MLPVVTSSDPCVRHGALHVLAQLARAFRSMAAKQKASFLEYVGRDITKQLLEVAPRVSVEVK